MAAIPSKIAKTSPPTKQGNKLWTHEDRMFDEKIFYLNKTASKYVITGLEAEYLQPVVKICDRVTGCHISIKKADFTPFTQIVSSILNGTYNMEKRRIVETIKLCNIEFECVTNNIWKLSGEEGINVVFIHTSSLNAFMDIEKLLLDRIMGADTAGYLTFISKLCTDTDDMNKSTLATYLYEQLGKFAPDCLEYNVLADFICNSDLYHVHQYSKIKYD